PPTRGRWQSLGTLSSLRWSPYGGGRAPGVPGECRGLSHPAVRGVGGSPGVHPAYFRQGNVASSGAPRLRLFSLLSNHSRRATASAPLLSLERLRSWRRPPQ